MTTLSSLSKEVIEIILSYKDISFEDIISFRCVCKKFRWAAKREEYCFSKQKFLQRWPSAKKYYDELEKNEQNQSKENKQKYDKSFFINMGISYAKELRNDMQNYVHKECNSKILSTINLRKRFSKLIFKKNNYIKILFLMDEIKNLLDQLVRSWDLKEGYYYIELLDNLKRRWRTIILYRYMEETNEELPEKSATIWAQQLQLGKNLSYSSVNASLNTIALGALNFLREKHPEHSIFSTPDNYFSHWENNKINNNYWSEVEGAQIMDMLRLYMLTELKFQPISSKELEYMCIDYVLENQRGKTIILYIIYQSVARRLGLRCDIIRTLPGCIYELLWMPNYTSATNYIQDVFSIAEVEKFRQNRYIIMRHTTPKPKSFWHDVLSVGTVIRHGFRSQAKYKRTPEQMLKSIMNRESLMDRSWNFNFPNTHLINHLKEYGPQTRPKDIKFAVGMIVTHVKKYTDCSTGVIIGWHQYNDTVIIRSVFKSYVMMPFKFCSNMTVGHTFYVILTKCNKLCVVEENDITLTKPNWIENRNIFRFFNHFKGTHYVPNKELAEVYPHDAAIAAETIFKD